MKINWEDWRQYYEFADVHLSNRPLILGAEEFEHTMWLLPKEFRHSINICGQSTDENLNKHSLLGFIRALPVLREFDYIVTAVEASNPKIDLQNYHGRYFTVYLFDGTGRRLMLSFDGIAIHFKISQRTEEHIGYTPIKSPAFVGTLEIVDYEDLGMLDKLLTLFTE